MKFEEEDDHFQSLQGYEKLSKFWREEEQNQNVSCFHASVVTKTEPNNNNGAHVEKGT